MTEPDGRLRRAAAVVLRAIDYSETSQVVHLYTRELGKVHAIAKGSKRRHSAFHGPFDVLVRADVVRMEKEPGTLDLLTSAETVREYRALRADYARFVAASYAADLVDDATSEGMPQPGLYDALVAALESLDSGAPVPETVFRFEAALLEQLGHFPRLGTCGRCGRPPAGSEVWFSPKDGGILCVSCPPKDSVRVLVKRVVVDGLEAMRARRAFNVGAYPGFVPELRQLLDLHLRWALDREPKSMRAMREAVLGSR